MGGLFAAAAESAPRTTHPSRAPFPQLQQLAHSTVVTPAEMSAERIPLAYRDKCASVLVPLNRCRKKEWYLPWKCEVSVLSVKCGIWNMDMDVDVNV